MYEQGLGDIRTREGTAPETVNDDANTIAKTDIRRGKKEYDEKNGKLFTRILLATIGTRDEYAGVAAQIVLVFAPVVVLKSFGDGRRAVLAL